MVGRCWDGKYMSQNSISASSLEVTGMFILQAGFSTEFFISMNGHNILLTTPAQSCSVIFDFFLLPSLFAASWSNQLPNPDTPQKSFSSLSPFPSPHYHSKFNDLSFRTQKLPNLCHCLQSLPYLVPCHHMKNSVTICVMYLFLCLKISKGSS